MDSLQFWLDEVSVFEVDEYHNAANGGRLAGVIGWWAVSDDDGVVAYLPTERDALRYRLDLINRRLNP